MGDLPSGKEEEWSHSLGDLPRGGMASFLWVTYLGKQKMENGLILWVTYLEKMMVSLWWVTYPSERRSGLILMGDLPRRKKCEKRSYYDGWPTQMERMWNAVLLWWSTYPNRKDVKCGLIVMGDLPKWKKMWKTVLLWWATYPDGKNVMNGLIIMGDLPRWKECDMTSVKNRTYLVKSWGDNRRKAGKLGASW